MRSLTIIAPSDLYYLQLEDPLPAGAEAIDASLATSSQLDQSAALGSSEQGRPWWWYWNWWSRSELRDDRAALFADWLPQGTYTERWWTGSLAAFARVYHQRIDAHAQWEVQQYAQAINLIVAPLFPHSWAALTGSEATQEATQTA